MSPIVAYDIVVHYNGKRIRILNVGLDKYSYIELSNDICEKVLHELPKNLNYLLHMKCMIPMSVATMDANTDRTVIGKV